MGMGENILTHLNGLRNHLSKNVKFLFPEQHILQKAFDKSKTLEYAKKLNIDHPETVEISNSQELDSSIENLKFPVVLKFTVDTPEPIPPDLRFKYKYAFSKEELLKILEKYKEYDHFPLIQEYIPGYGIGVELCIYKNQVVGAFQHERIHEYPISGGVSVYRKSAPLSPDLYESSLRLLREMEWEGVAMVEFRKDLKENRTALMEINGRFWGSLPLALKSGVNFPYILYLSMGKGESPKPKKYLLNKKVKQLSSHFKWLIDAFIKRKNLPPEGFKSRTRVLAEFMLSFDPRVRYDIEEWNDPLPAIVFWLKKIPIISRMTNKLLKFEKEYDN